MQFNLVTSVVTPAPDLPPLKASGVISTSISNMGTQATFDLWYILQVLMDSEDIAASLLQVLLRHYAERRSLPAQAAVYVPSAMEKQGVLRIVRSAAGLLSMSSKVSVSVAGCR